MRSLVVLAALVAATSADAQTVSCLRSDPLAAQPPSPPVIAGPIAGSSYLKLCEGSSQAGPFAIIGADGKQIGMMSARALLMLQGFDEHSRP